MPVYTLIAAVFPLIGMRHRLSMSHTVDSTHSEMCIPEVTWCKASTTRRSLFVIHFLTDSTPILACRAAIYDMDDIIILINLSFLLPTTLMLLIFKLGW